MPVARTAPLRNELERALPSRPFAIRFWDGTDLPATEPDSPTFRFKTPQALAHVLRAPGELGIGRAYVAGMIEVDDLDGALGVIDTFEPPPLTIRQQLRLGLGVVRACGIVVPPRISSTELRLRGERHTIARDRRAVRHHYDVGNDFFALFLDPSMTYSCAVFSRGANTLEEAQQQKLELVCTKLGIRERGTAGEAGGRVLDVGCGWGGFAIHAATRHGTRVLGITLSEPQAELARERVRAAGLADRIEIRIADYRELSGESFDAIASIEMVEAVGEERIDEYAARLAGLLSPGGRLLNHGIAKLKDFDTPDEGAFSERFVFPDGVPLPLSRIQLALERSGLVTTHVEEFQADTPRLCVTGSSGTSNATTTPFGTWAQSARGSGGSTSGRRGSRSRPTGPRSTKCWRTGRRAGQSSSGTARIMLGYRCEPRLRRASRNDCILRPVVPPLYSSRYRKARTPETAIVGPVLLRANSIVSLALSSPPAAAVGMPA